VTEDHRPLEGDLTAIFQFDVGELNVRRDQLGTVLERQEGGRSVQVEFPDADGNFRAPLMPARWAHTIKGRRGDDGKPDQIWVVGEVQVRVDLGVGLGDEGAGNAEAMLVRDARPTARAVMRRILDWARTQDRQVWLLPPHMPPPEAAEPRLINAAGEVTHRGYGAEGGVVVLLGRDYVVSGDMRAAIASEGFPEAESLLAEAQWALWPGNPYDTKRAVLLAAIALEVKTPQTLQALAQGTTRQLLDAILARFDETPVSVYFQLTDLAEAVDGESLKGHDGKLAKSVRELYKLRNEVAHRGQTPTEDDARRAVAAAEGALEWLNRRLAKTA
jgi:hypothetical protein